MNQFRIPVYEPQIGEEETALVLDCMKSGWISSKGYYVDRFEEDMAQYLDSKHAIALSNGTTALHTAVLALGIGQGDEVIVPSLTYIASANAIAYTGAKPVFVDSQYDNWQMDPEDIRAAITPRTRAIMAVHLYGHPCDMDKLDQIANEHNLPIIEDCAESLGAKYREKHTGTIGTIATFSFYGNKTITTGEGGLIATQSEEIASRVKHIKGQGLAASREYWHDIIGYNYRMTNICAAIGCAQLKKISDILKRKAEIATFYREHLQSIGQFQSISSHVIHSHWMVCFLTDSKQERDQLRNHLRYSGIETRPVFFPINEMPMYSDGARETPRAHDIGHRGINLPSHPGLTNEQLNYIVEKCLSFKRQ